MSYSCHNCQEKTLQNIPKLTTSHVLDVFVLQGSTIVQARNSLYFFREQKLAIYRFLQNVWDIPPYIA
jgi:hypothetical protein